MFIIPSVAMKAGIRSLVTTNPFTKPKTTPKSKAATTVKTTPKEGNSSEIRTPQSPSKPATDRSKAPETIRGIALLVTQGQSVMITKHIAFGLLNNGKILGLPVPFIIMMIVFIVLSILLKHTPFGRHACAIGGNRAAAIVSGINIDRTTIVVFGLVGVSAAISGVMLGSQLMIVDATLGTGFELQAITVSVLGGTSLAGGHGNLIGTVFAALLLATIASALNILKVISFYQYLALGTLLIFALAIDTARRAFIAKSFLSRA
jgi:ribose transport system permease protein